MGARPQLWSQGMLRKGICSERKLLQRKPQRKLLPPTTPPKRLRDSESPSSKGTWTKYVWQADDNDWHFWWHNDATDEFFFEATGTPQKPVPSTLGKCCGKESKTTPDDEDLENTEADDDSNMTPDDDSSAQSATCVFPKPRPKKPLPKPKPSAKWPSPSEPPPSARPLTAQEGSDDDSPTPPWRQPSWYRKLFPRVQELLFCCWEVDGMPHFNVTPFRDQPSRHDGRNLEIQSRLVQSHCLAFQDLFAKMSKHI